MACTRCAEELELAALRIGELEEREPELLPLIPARLTWTDLRALLVCAAGNVRARQHEGLRA
jgi:hypothetical protein